MEMEKKLFDALRQVEACLVEPATEPMLIEMARTFGRILGSNIPMQLADGERDFYAIVCNRANDLDKNSDDSFTRVTANCMLQSSLANTFNADDKRALCTVAEILGPDHLEWWRKAIAFAIKTEQF
jgi:predicted  nucleic acid-binding Zn ribbon protein